MLRKLSKWGLITGALLLMTSSGWAQSNTYWGGFEDSSGSGSDYDYNDLVFSISGNVTIHTTAGLFAEPALVSTGTFGQAHQPFWDNVSSDGATYNIGYCIYGGGNCNGGTALDPGGDYYASTPSSVTNSANDIYFTSGGDVHTNVVVTITADKADTLGWINLSTGVVTFGGAGLTTFNIAGGTTFAFVGAVGSPAPSAPFYFDDLDTTSDAYLTSGAKIGTVNGATVAGVTGNSIANTSDDVDHFVFFNSPVPEPGALALLGTSLVGIGFAFRRRMRNNA